MVQQQRSNRTRPCLPSAARLLLWFCAPFLYSAVIQVVSLNFRDGQIGNDGHHV